MELSNREIASLILLGALGAYLVWHRGTRRSLPGIAAAFFTPKVFVPIVGLLASTCGLVVLGMEAGLWEPRLVPQTVAWILIPGVSLLYGVATRTPGEPFFRHTALRAFRLTGFIEVVVGFFVFGLVVELVLLVVLAVLGMLLAVAESEDEFRPVKSMLEGVLAVIGLALVVLATVNVVSGWDTFDKTFAARALFLPVGLTLGVMPYLYAVALWAGYDHAFMRINHQSDNQRTRWRAKLGLLLALHLRAAQANAFHGHWPRKITEASSVTDAREVGRDILRDHQRRAEETQEAEERLDRYAGAQGADEDGRRRDHREFAETKKTLQRLASMQMGWYQHRGGRYRPELVKILRPEGLPAEHGIVLSVSRDGQGWWAWRRTVTGWCFAIGAAKEPPDQWLYDGADPPNGFPAKDPGWGDQRELAAPNW